MFANCEEEHCFVRELVAELSPRRIFESEFIGDCGELVNYWAIIEQGTSDELHTISNKFSFKDGHWTKLCNQLPYEAMILFTICKQMKKSRLLKISNTMQRLPKFAINFNHNLEHVRYFVIKNVLDFHLFD